MDSEGSWVWNPKGEVGLDVGANRSSREVVIFICKRNTLTNPYKVIFSPLACVWLLRKYRQSVKRLLRAWIRVICYFLIVIFNKDHYIIPGPLRRGMPEFYLWVKKIWVKIIPILSDCEQISLDKKKTKQTQSILSGVMSKVLDFDIVISDFQTQAQYNGHFWT